MWHTQYGFILTTQLLTFYGAGCQIRTDVDFSMDYKTIALDRYANPAYKIMAHAGPRPSRVNPFRNRTGTFSVAKFRKTMHMHDLITPYVVQMEGFEPPATCSQSMPSTADLHLDIMRVFFRLSPSCPVDISQP